MAAQTNTPTISPRKLAHVVLRSHNLEKMKNFYLQFLGATVAFEVPGVLAFLRYDEEHHRLGIIGMPDIGDKVKKSNGLEVRLIQYLLLQERSEDKDAMTNDASTLLSRSTLSATY